MKEKESCLKRTCTKPGELFVSIKNADKLFHATSSSFEISPIFRMAQTHAALPYPEIKLKS
ncbi:hypothetical protein HNQ69_001472 [Bartonella callosciuri]|uniref:Uncharacterized protein n=1 Tax=Bartonella callosciuri TaxID=686223 RepID=A0A840NS38_9HYPH|nr:hypothetical protein [Bartonella callosciuri]